MLHPLLIIIVIESVFESVNQDREKQEGKERAKSKNGILRNYIIN